MNRRSLRRPSRAASLLALAGLTLSIALAGCGRSGSLTSPTSSSVGRSEADGFAKGGVKGKPQAPSAPTLASPANGATAVAVPAALSWNAAAGASSYGLQVSTSATFNTTVINVSGLTGTSFAAAGLAANTTYFWRVNARNAGGTSAFSAAFSFTTAATVAQPPAAPALSAPLNGAVGVAVDPTLSWAASAGATSYHVQVATDAGFTALVVNTSGVAATSLGVSGLANSTAYFWRVSASNANGEGAFSGAFSFTTAAIAPPPPPPPGDPCASLTGKGGTVANEAAEVVQFRPGNRLRIEVVGDVAGAVINALGTCSTTDPVSVTWPAGGSASVRYAGTATSITGGGLSFPELLFPGALLEPGVVVGNDAVGNVLEVVWPEIAGVGVGAPILRLQLAQWDPAVASGTALDVDMTFIARAADGSTAQFVVSARNILVP